MKHLWIYILLLASVVSSCDKRRVYPCEISISVSKDAPCDSLSVYCYESDYNRTRLLYNGVVKDSLKLMEYTNTMVPDVAYFCIGSDTVCHYFVLEPGRVDIQLLKDWVLITSGGTNRHLFEFRKKIRSIDKQRELIDSLYRKHAGDSTLTFAQEQRWFKRDSVMSDSLQRLFKAFVNRGDAAAAIVREQYAKRLSLATWKDVLK